MPSLSIEIKKKRKIEVKRLLLYHRRNKKNSVSVSPPMIVMVSMVDICQGLRELFENKFGDNISMVNCY